MCGLRNRLPHAASWIEDCVLASAQSPDSTARRQWQGVADLRMNCCVGSKTLHKAEGARIETIDGHDACPAACGQTGMIMIDRHYLSMPRLRQAPALMAQAPHPASGEKKKIKRLNKSSIFQPRSHAERRRRPPPEAHQTNAQLLLAGCHCRTSCRLQRPSST